MLKPGPTDIGKLSNILENNVAKKTVHDEFVEKLIYSE